MIEQLKKEYIEKQEEIKKRLNDFKSLSEDSWIDELLFCLLTPQSQAKKCWQAIEELKESRVKEKEAVKACLATKTRFHNNKTKYILEARENWLKIKEKIKQTKDIIELRNILAEEVLGLGMKEASHFLRNIGKSNNQVAILDRHILRNLQELGIIKEIKSLNKNNYLEIERKFKDFSSKINIPLDYLDLLFWSRENGTIFK